MTDSSEGDSGALFYATGQMRSFAVPDSLDHILRAFLKRGSYHFAGHDSPGLVCAPIPREGGGGTAQDLTALTINHTRSRAARLHDKHHKTDGPTKW